MKYTVDNKELDAEDFLSLARQVWPGEYDLSLIHI